ncbi:MAG: hypothetical protein HKN78_08580 [Sphingomonadaceae bacterium]|nr:hypothetical protein [Sphingomonadaceae bacterium]
MTEGPIIIVGMHRSGTSCLAGCLQSAGLYLGEVNTKAPANRKGNRENRAIMDLHEDVFQANNVSWDRPSSRLDWNDSHVEWQAEIIRSYPAKRVWGFKDPRTLMVIDQWLRAIPHARIAATFRHPLQVARSLQQRDNFEPERALSIWRTYNSELVRICKSVNVEIVNFDLPPRDYERKVGTICGRLNLDGPQVAGTSFFDPWLRSSQVFQVQSLPQDIVDIHDALLSLSA